MYVFNIPVLFIWIWNAIRCRSLFFFTATNPGIPTGGFFGESKLSILEKIPDEFRPQSILWKTPVADKDVEQKWRMSGLTFPIIVKPEVGERGWHVTKISSFAELKSYLSKNKIDIILQPFLTHPIELAVMTYWMPDGSKSDVSSICLKKFLAVTGDGKRTLEELVLADARATLQYETIEKKFSDEFHSVIPGGEYRLLEPVGNHCRGTAFLNANHEIDDAIRKVMTTVLEKMDGIYYGRFDMKIASWEEFRAGKNIAIMEFNGASSDPAHIYDPGYSLWRAYRDIAFHWGVMGRIARQNRRRGVKTEGIREIISALSLYFRYKRTN